MEGVTGCSQHSHPAGHWEPALCSQALEHSVLDCTGGSAHERQSVIGVQGIPSGIVTRLGTKTHSSSQPGKFRVGVLGKGRWESSFTRGILQSLLGLGVLGQRVLRIFAFFSSQDISGVSVGKLGVLWAGMQQTWRHWKELKLQNSAWGREDQPGAENRTHSWAQQLFVLSLKGKQGIPVFCCIKVDISCCLAEQCPFIQSSRGENAFRME